MQNDKEHLSESADALIIASPPALDKLSILNAAKLEFTTGSALP